MNNESIHPGRKLGLKNYPSNTSSPRNPNRKGKLAKASKELNRRRVIYDAMPNDVKTEMRTYGCNQAGCSVTVEKIEYKTQEDCTQVRDNLKVIWDSDPVMQKINVSLTCVATTKL